MLRDLADIIKKLDKMVWFWNGCVKTEHLQKGLVSTIWQLDNCGIQIPIVFNWNVQMKLQNITIFYICFLIFIKAQMFVYSWIEFLLKLSIELKLKFKLNSTGFGRCNQSLKQIFSINQTIH